VTAVLLAGLGADVCKLIIARARPRSFDLNTASIWDTFGRLFPIDTIQSHGQGFPSAHTATAAAFAVMLAWAYPRGRWLFAALAVMVALQRVETCAHFLSDTLVGGAIGWAAGAHMLHPQACFGRIARLEAWLARKFSPAPSADAAGPVRRAA
jgi:membrane-associated phospholipid phosphatase